MLGITLIDLQSMSYEEANEVLTEMSYKQMRKILTDGGVKLKKDINDYNTLIAMCRALEE